MGDVLLDRTRWMSRPRCDLWVCKGSCYGLMLRSLERNVGVRVEWLWVDSSLACELGRYQPRKDHVIRWFWWPGVACDTVLWNLGPCARVCVVWYLVCHWDLNVFVPDPTLARMSGRGSRRTLAWSRVTAALIHMRSKVVPYCGLFNLDLFCWCCVAISAFGQLKGLVLEMRVRLPWLIRKLVFDVQSHTVHMIRNRSSSPTGFPWVYLIEKQTCRRSNKLTLGLMLSIPGRRALPSSATRLIGSDTFRWSRPQHSMSRQLKRRKSRWKPRFDVSWRKLFVDSSQNVKPWKREVCNASME